MVYFILETQSCYFLPSILPFIFSKCNRFKASSFNHKFNFLTSRLSISCIVFIGSIDTTFCWHNIFLRQTAAENKLLAFCQPFSNIFKNMNWVCKKNHFSVTKRRCLLEVVILLSSRNNKHKFSDAPVLQTYIKDYRRNRIVNVIICCHALGTVAVSDKL